ncbi:MAG: cellulase family glycosylhydrolase [Anaerolineae bacterium]|nr:cellulase family glycosylhydrolase [Anaerolineae bacterium]
MICVAGSRFRDERGRTLILRGVNLGGSSKVPSRPDGATHRREGFFEHRDVSFVGRPFPLAEADEHFGRLAAWGFTFLRFLVTWEAIEHAGPGVYDEAYLDYVRAVVKKAAGYGIDLFIDPHQDVWSRFTGGDGAPGWTLEAVGFDITRFAETGAAIVHATHGDPFPKMIWPTNGGKLAAATMFTLFFGGNDFAPETRIAGEPAQEFLQRHYIAAIQQLALRLADLPNVVGYDTMNEPLPGYIGWRDLNVAGGPVLLGACPTPLQGMLLGAGLTQEVGVWELGTLSIRRRGARVLNKNRQRVWRDGYDCIWRQHGVWDLDAAGRPHLLRPDYFSQVAGHPVDFGRDYYRPFAERFARAIHAVDPDALVFLEPTPGDPLPPLDGRSEGFVFAPHWYDGYVLMTKHFSPFLAVDVRTRRPVFLPGPIRRSFGAQLADLRREGEMAGMPVLLGEFGIPFDLNEKEAYRTGDFSVQIRALDRSFRAVEDNLLSCTLWNYTADNTDACGDGWNGEDFSIFSRDQQDNPSDINSGGRALRAAVRPYPRAVAGEPLRMAFDLRRRVFEFEFRHDPQVAAPTEIFVPVLQYPEGYRVEVSDGTFEKDSARQVLVYRHDPEQRQHIITISPMSA